VSHLYCSLLSRRLTNALEELVMPLCAAASGADVVLLAAQCAAGV
jgi:hypothetical protein